LLDAGSTSAFISNAKTSGVYDAYLSQNQNVNVYAMKNEQYYSASGGVLHNIAVPMSVQQNHMHCFILINKMTQIDKDVYLISHNTELFRSINKRSQLYVKKNQQFIDDNFSHELSLVFKTSKGLIQNIIEEVKQSLPNQNTYTFIGGLHLKGKKNGKEICTFSKEEIKTMCECLIKENIQLYTGHCTGLIGYKMIKDIMGKKSISTNNRKYYRNIAILIFIVTDFFIFSKMVTITDKNIIICAITCVVII